MVVGSAICLHFVGMVDFMVIAVLVPSKVEVMGRVMEVVPHGFLGVQWGAFALRCSAILPHLIDEEYFGHVVDDEHLGPVRDWLGLGATEVNVHDEDGERGGGCDHSHCCDVVLSWSRGQARHGYGGKPKHLNDRSWNQTPDLLTLRLQPSLCEITCSISLWQKNEISNCAFIEDDEDKMSNLRIRREEK